MVKLTINLSPSQSFVSSSVVVALRPYRAPRRIGVERSRIHPTPPTVGHVVLEHVSRIFQYSPMLTCVGGR